MKFKSILFVSVVSILCFSCENTTQEKNITGFWTANSIHVNSINVMNSAPYFTNVKGDIKADQTFISYSDFDTTSGTWEKTNTVLTVYMSGDTFIYDYNMPDATHLNMQTTIMGNYSEYEFSK